MGGTSFLFGTVTASHNADSIRDLKRHFDNTPSLQWMRDTTSELPSYWDLLRTKVPNIEGSYPGRKILEDFDRWLRQGFSPEEESVSLGNTTILPLVVMVGLTEFWQHIESMTPGSEDPLKDFLARLRTDEGSSVESIGLCAGMLTAYAVASSRTRLELQKYGAAAIRLAMMVGVAIDAQDAWHGPAKSYVASWRTPEQGEQMKRTINLVYPQAYVSVWYDERRVTITTTAQWIRSSVLRQLQGAGLTVAESTIQGRPHCPDKQSKDMADTICELCKVTPALQLADASELAFQTYTNDGQGLSVQNSLHEVALQSTLATQCSWYETFASLSLSRADSTQAVVSFGPDRCVPQSLVASLTGRLTHVSNLGRLSAAPTTSGSTNSTAPATPASTASATSATPVAPIQLQQPESPKDNPAIQPPPSESENTQEKAAENIPKKGSERHSGSNKTSPAPEDTIAVIGMSIKAAGADDVDEFSRMIQSGVSQHQLIGPDRVKFHTLWREGDWDPSYKWYANWMRNIDHFDHQFFKRSPREAANMDPQQRLAMQAAYQAIEKAGYYARDESPGAEKKDEQLGSDHIGVYVGITLDDYQNHVRSQRANAFSITGTMRSLIAGKIAHHFGWTGPAMTADTACSSSAVAIHNACRDILAGDCTAALAGGANVITDPLAFQDLAAAGFLSPSGQCKPFDDRADGYCRGEAVGFVFLKRLSDALADGNQILGCINSSAIFQNENHTPIVVPNSPSLSGLFKHVMNKAHVQPSDISFVECHGTGTPVGDPAEWDSVRQALEGPKRTDPVYVGSAKGHVGHTEAASGVVALVKVLTMMQSGHIPPQASHSRLSHLIQPTDMMQVASTQKPWTSERKVALLNNYGASGSNVAMIISKPSFSRPLTGQINAEKVALPFCIAGRTVKSVKANCSQLLGHLDIHPEIRLDDLSFNLHRQFSRSLSNRYAFKSQSLEDLKAKLSRAASGADAEITAPQLSRPVILCFGGQVSMTIGLDRNLYDRTRILRHYLDECDAAIQSFGLKSIYPDIFSQEPVPDQQHLQTMLFAMQYSCAMCWIQSGLSGCVAAVVGHSFGELTALCISGVLSLHDAVKLVAGRAKLIRDLWGPDAGVMLALEADEDTVHSLITEANKVYTGTKPSNIACYNGPRSFTVAGSQEAIAAVTDLISQKFTSVRSKTLPVTNAFHSSLVDPLEQQLEQLGQSISFQKPRIPLERTTEKRLPAELFGARYPVEQMRQPVYFHHAVQRLAQEHPDSVWLEAGSNSTVTVMAQRALASSTPRMTHHFQGLKINRDDGFNNLSEVTISLWKAGTPASFWPHNASQTHDYANLVLPPYQFEKEKHWVELRDPVEYIEKVKAAVRAELPQIPNPHENSMVDSNSRWFFTGYKDSSSDTKKQPCFQINTAAKGYQELVNSHLVAYTAGICSGMLQVDLAVGALFSLHPEWMANGWRATLRDATNHAPVCLDVSRVLSLEFEDQGNSVWDWRIVSSSEGTSRVLHTTGRFQVRDPRDNAWHTEFRRLARLIDHQRCLALLNIGPSDENVEILQGRNIYRTFSHIVDFGEQYRSLRWLVGKDNESAGRFSRTPKNDAWYDQLFGEHISQVGGIWVNCISDHSPSDIFLGAEIEMRMISPDWASRPLPSQCDVLARHQRHETGDYTSDSFVFDAASGELVEVLLGVRFIRTPSASFTRALQRMTSGQKPAENVVTNAPTISQPVPVSMPAPASSQTAIEPPKPAPTEPQSTKSSDRDLLKEMGEVVANLVGVEASEIGPDANLADFGVDSLLGLELQAEIKTAFSCTPDEVEMMGATTIRELVGCLPIAGDFVDSGASHQPPADMSADEAGSASQPSDPYWSNPVSEDSRSTSTGIADLFWNPSDILEAFSGTKKRGDEMIVEHGLDNYDSVIIPESNRLCAALVVECFDDLGCPLRTAKAGDLLDPVPFEPQHKILMKYIYQFLEKTINLVTVEDNGKLRRTETPTPTMRSEEILHELLPKYPSHGDFLRLTHHAGIHLSRALSGKTDGNRVLMSNPEGRRLCQAVYHNYGLNQIGFETMRDVLDRVSHHIHEGKGPLRILEMGAGTGSASSVMLPLLASLNIPVEYTFTDLSSSLVAQARRTLGKKYPFMKFAVQDIEKPVPDEFAGQQHIVIASHAVHATRSLEISTRSIRHALRPDGFLMVLEMREAWPALDLTFGLYEGWWLFEDGRTHAYTSPEVWKRDLTAAGYGAVDWTDGTLPEHKYYMVLIAMASAIDDK